MFATNIYDTWQTNLLALSPDKIADSSEFLTLPSSTFLESRSHYSETEIVLWSG